MNALLRFLAILLSSTFLLLPIACDKSSDKDDKSEDEDEKDEDEEDDDDDDDDDDEGKKKKKKKKKGKKLSGDDDDDDTKAKSATSGPKAGAILDYMPTDCGKARVYLNTGALFSDTSAQNLLRDITTKLLNKEREADAHKAVKVLKDSGFDLATGIREGAACVHTSEDDIVIGVTLSVPNPLGLVNKIGSSLGEFNLPIEKKGSAKFMQAGDTLLVQPADHILVFGPPARAKTATEKKGGSGFASARGQVGYFFAPIDADASMEGKITRAASNFNLWGALKFDADTASKARKQSKDFEQEMRKNFLKDTAKYKGTPFALLDDRLQTATFQFKGEKLIVTMSVPATDVTTLLKAAAPELGVSTGGGNAPTPSSGDNDPLDDFLDMMKKGK